MTLQSIREPATDIDSSAGLHIQGLCKAFHHQPVLKGIDLAVDKGEFITVLGPSGSGKTTLLRLICGFERPDSGSITLDGCLVTRGGGRHLPPEKRGIGYVAQEGALFPHLTVADNLLFGLSRQLRGSSRKQKAHKSAELLELVGLPSHYAMRRPAVLSGGEQQRVALARALAPAPAMVLLDEPFSALDAALRTGLRSAILDTLKRVNTTALLVTHDQDEALSMGDRVAVLQHGNFVQVAPPQALYRFPVNRELASFVGEAVLVTGTLTANNSVACCFGSLPLAVPCPQSVGRDVEVMLRPEQFRLRKDGTPATENSLTASVDDLVFYGHDAKLTLRLPCGQQFIASTSGMTLPQRGQSVSFRVAGPVVCYAMTETAT